MVAHMRVKQSFDTMRDSSSLSSDMALRTPRAGSIYGLFKKKVHLCEVSKLIWIDSLIGRVEEAYSLLIGDHLSSWQ